MHPDRQVRLAAFLGIAAGVTLAILTAFILRSMLSHVALSLLFHLNFDSILFFAPLLCIAALPVGSVAMLKGRSWGRFLVVCTACLLLLIGMISFMMYGFGNRYPIVSINLVWGIVLFATFNSRALREHVPCAGRLRSIERFMYVFFAVLLVISVGIYAFMFRTCTKALTDPFHVPQKIVLAAGNPDGTHELKFHGAVFKLPAGFSVNYMDHRVHEGELARMFRVKIDDMLFLENEDKSIALIFSNQDHFGYAGWAFGYRNSYEYANVIAKERIGLVFYTFRAIPDATYDEIEIGEWRGFREISHKQHGNSRSIVSFSIWHRPTGESIDIAAFLTDGKARVETVQQFLSSISHSPEFADKSVYFERGQKLVQDGQFKTATVDLSTALLMDWENPVYQLEMGRAVLGNGFPCSAQMYIHKALQLKPDYAEAREIREQAEKECEMKRAAKAAEATSKKTE